MKSLLRIVAPHFVAGAEFTGDICTRPASILNYLYLTDACIAINIIRRNGWQYEWIPVEQTDDGWRGG